MRLSANKPCPCHSGWKAKGCCGPVLRGQPALSPEALMRSRYAAYATGAVGHIINTTHPESPHQVADLARWRAEVSAFCERTDFVSLTIHDSGTSESEAWVHFTAGLMVLGEAQDLTERSRFLRVGAQWMYHSGETD